MRAVRGDAVAAARARRTHRRWRDAERRSTEPTADGACSAPIGLVTVVPTDGRARPSTRPSRAAASIGLPRGAEGRAAATAMAKTVAAGFALDLPTRPALRAAWERMAERLGDRAARRRSCSRWSSPGVDVAVAVHDHPPVGPCISLGPGGAAPPSTTRRRRPGAAARRPRGRRGSSPAPASRPARRRGRDAPSRRCCCGSARWWRRCPRSAALALNPVIVARRRVDASPRSRSTVARRSSATRSRRVRRVVAAQRGRPRTALAEDVAQDLGRAAHDRVGGRVADVAAHPAAEARLGEHAPAGPSTAAQNCGDALLELGAERLGGGGELLGRLAEHLAQHEEPADPVAGLDGGDLLADQRVGRCRPAARHVVVQLAVATASRSMPPRSCSICRITWRKLPLSSPTRFSAGTRTSSKNTSQKWSLPVMSLIGVIVMPGRAHVDDQLGQALVGRRVGIGAGDQVDPVGRSRRPRSRSSGRSTTKSSPSRTARVRMTATSDPASGSDMPMLHADVPSRMRGEVRRAAARACRTAAAWGPSGGRRTTTSASGAPVGDERLEHDEPLERGCGRRRRPRRARSCRASRACPAPARTRGRAPRSRCPR